MPKKRKPLDKKLRAAKKRTMILSVNNDTEKNTFCNEDEYWPNDDNDNYYDYTSEVDKPALNLHSLAVAAADSDHDHNDDDDDDDDDDDNRQERFEGEEGPEKEVEEIAQEDNGVEDESGNNIRVEELRNYQDIIYNFSVVDYSAFDILNVIDPMVSKLLVENNDEEIDQELYHNSQHSSADFANFIKSFGFTITNETKMLSGLKTFFPFANLPVRETKTHKIVSTLYRDYDRVYPIDICMNGCMAYIDETEACTICGTPRFTPSNQTPIKRLYLLPIIPKLVRLIKTDDFINLLTFKREKFSSKEGIYSDISDGQLYKDSLKSMSKKFNEKKSTYHDNKPCVEVSLCLSMFYDGMMLYKFSATNFNPVGFTILNLPPTHRHEYGTGMFCGGIMTSTCGDNVEKFFLVHCLVKELLLLQEGLVIVYKNTRYILQAQVICYDLDLKAFEKLMCTVQCNSCHCCNMCTDFHARKDVSQDRMQIKGAAVYLPNDNFVRFYGRTDQCCPLHYFGNGDDEAANTYVENDIDVTNLDLDKNYHFPVKDSWKILKPCSPENTLAKLNGTLHDKYYTLRELSVVRKLNQKCFVKMEAWHSFYKSGTSWPYRGIRYADAYVTGTVASIYDLQFNYVTVEIPVFKCFYTLQVESLFLVFESEVNPMSKDNEITTELYKKYEKTQYTIQNQREDWTHYGNKKDNEDDIVIIGQGGECYYHEFLDDNNWLKSIHKIADAQYCDHRPQRPSFSLLSHENYIEYGRIATQLREQTKGKNSKEKVAYKGIKSITPFCLLSYFRFDHLRFESSHALKNCLYNILQHLIGGIKITPAYYSLSKKYNMYNILENVRDNGKSTFTAPWTLSENSQHKVDSMINSMMLPSGFKDYGVKYVCQKPGYLNMAACIQLLSSPILIYGLSELESHEIPDGYFFFLIMLVRDIADLLQPVIRKEEIWEIRARIIEIVAIKEKIFPDTSALIIYHQVMHLADHIELTGPVATNNSMWGERMLGKQKLNKTIGGSDDIGTLARRSEADECNAECIYKLNDKTGTRDAFLKKVNRFYKYEKNTYIEFPFYLLKPEKRIHLWNPFEKSELLKALICEIENQSKTEKDALTKSPLYRLYKTHKCLKIGDNLLKFIDTIYAAITDTSEEALIPYGIKITDEAHDKVDLPRFIEENKYEKHIILADVSSVKSFLDTGIKVRRQGIVYGERFNCRGVSCSEKSAMVGNAPTNVLNDLSENCTHKKSYGSWAMFYSRSDEYKNTFLDMPSAELNLGQLNYFFRVNIPHDSILSNVPFASVTARNFGEEYNILYVIDLNDNQNFDSKIYFTAATAIIPTVFGVGFLDEANKACIIAKARHKSQSNQVKLKYSSSNKPAKLKLVKLSMSRDSIHYIPENNPTYNCIDYDM